jgi:hypothetical protein
MRPRGRFDDPAEAGNLYFWAVLNRVQGQAKKSFSSRSSGF